jgi:hypothetical protein
MNKVEKKNSIPDVNSQFKTILNKLSGYNVTKTVRFQSDSKKLFALENLSIAVN